MDKHLRENLEQLQREIEQAEFGDAQDEASLRELADDIRGLLDSSERRREQDESLTERLSHAIEKFEESHPTLTANLARLADALGRAAV